MKDLWPVKAEEHGWGKQTPGLGQVQEQYLNSRNWNFLAWYKVTGVIVSFTLAITKQGKEHDAKEISSANSFDKCKTKAMRALRAWY